MISMTNLKIPLLETLFLLLLFSDVSLELHVMFAFVQPKLSQSIDFFLRPRALLYIFCDTFNVSPQLLSLKVRQSVDSASRFS